MRRAYGLGEMMSAPTTRTLRGHRIALAEVLALVAAVAVGLALDRAYAPTLFTRSTSNFWDRLAILVINLAPYVVLGAMALLGMRVLLPRLRWWTRIDLESR